MVGIDTLRYYWQHKSPEQSAADLSKLMQHYREKWGAKRFVLAGYSFGADILPAIYNRLPGKDQQQVKAMLLLALARTGSFEIEVEGWLGKAGEEAATGPEMARLPAAKVFCIYGAEEKDESGCTQPQAVGEARTAGRPPLRRGLPVPGEEDAPGHPRPRERSRRLIAIKLSPLRPSCPRPTPARLSLPGAFRLASAEPPRIPADPPQSGLPRAEEKEP